MRFYNPSFLITSDATKIILISLGMIQIFLWKLFNIWTDEEVSDQEMMWSSRNF